MVIHLYSCRLASCFRSRKIRLAFIFFFIIGLAGFFSPWAAASCVDLNYCQSPDSLQIAALDSKISGYAAAIENQPVDVKIQESDFLIVSCKSQEIRNHVVSRLFSHYLNSSLMGDEAVAVHIVDEWINTGKAELRTQVETLNARIFADFNRSSLIGCKAPSLRLLSPDGEVIDALGVRDSSGAADSAFAGTSDRLRIIYFYATDCSKCRVESFRLKNFLDTVNIDLDVLLVYTGNNAGEWKNYRSEHLAISSPSCNVYHYWDPCLDSDFQRKYGILQTPGMFLVDRKGIIIGRKLDTDALRKLLPVSSKSYIYGSEESEALFDNIFSSLGRPSPKDVIGVAKYIDSKLYSSGQTDIFKKMSGDLMFYLAGRKGAAYKAGERYVVDSLILSRPDVWNGREDTLRVVGMAMILSQMLGRADAGTVVPDVKVSGELRGYSCLRSRPWPLRHLHRDAYIVFYSAGCADCKAELAAADSLLASHSLTAPSGACGRRVSVLYVNMDEVMSGDSRMAEKLLDSFDLSALPYITYIDRKGIVRGKYLSFIN